MNKKVLATAGIAALAVSATVAKADEVTTNDQASTTVSVSSTATQAVPTQAQVETAREQASAANQVVSQQASVVANNEATVNQAQANLATADANLQQAQTATNEASPEAIAAAQGQVTTAEKAANDAKSAVDSAQSAEKSAKDAADKQQVAVNADQAKVNAKAIEVADAQKSVDAAKATLNDSSVADVASNQAKAQTAFDEATVAEKKAQEELAAAEAAKKKAKASTATTANARQRFTVSSEYVNALKTYESKTATAAEKAQAEQTLKNVNKRDRSNNSYQDNEADKNVTISNLNNLSEAQMTDLSLYASSLINQIRTAFGTTQTSVSKGSVLAADRVTDGYVADNWGWESILNNQHDAAALDRAGKSFYSVRIGENLNTWQGLIGPFTLNEIKKYIYEAMLDFMFNGNEWNHARSIAGLISDGGETYIGTDISVVADAFNVHVNNVNKNSISSDSSFDTTKIANPYETNQSQPAPISNQTAAKQVNDQAQSDLASELAAAQTNLSEKQAALATAKSELEKANTAVENLNANAQEKVAALSKAQATLDEKQAELQTAKANLATSSATLQRWTNAYNAAKQVTAKKQAALTQANQALTVAKNRVVALTNASGNLAKAKAERATAFDKLTVAKGVLSAERAKLVELSAKRDKLTSDYTTLQTVFDNYMKAKADKERQTQLAKEFANITSKDLTPVPIYDVDGKVVAFTIQEKAAQTVAQIPVNYAQTKAEKQAPVQAADSLPETGESAVAGLSPVGFFMIILAFLGFVDRRTRRN